MARKFLGMGYTRTRRYANHKSEKKYEQNPQKTNSQVAEKKARQQLRYREEGPEKAKAAAIFKEKWEMAKASSKYQQLMATHRKHHG